VHPGQPLLPQLLEVLTQGLQLAEFLPSHSLSSGEQRNRAAVGKHWERSGSIVPQVKPFLMSPLHRSGHGDFNVRIYLVPGLDMDDHAPKDCQLNFEILWMLNTEEILSQINLRVDP
jgi:hypothetical protein